MSSVFRQKIDIPRCNAFDFVYNTVADRASANIKALRKKIRFALRGARHNHAQIHTASFDCGLYSGTVKITA